MFHVNMLKPYHNQGNLVLITREGKKEGTELKGWGQMTKGSTVSEVNLVPTLIKEQQRHIKVVLTDYQSIFSNFPGRTKIAEHKIDPGDTRPIAFLPYRVTGPNVICIENEVKEMLNLRLIVPGYLSFKTG